MTASPSLPPAAVDLSWLPLGAGASVVRSSGRTYEALVARRERRAPAALYHAALEVEVPEARFALELAPVPDLDAAGRGVVLEGPVGSRHLARWRIFRYELRCWADDVCGGSRSRAYATTGGPLTEEPTCNHQPATSILAARGQGLSAPVSRDKRLSPSDGSNC